MWSEGQPLSSSEIRKMEAENPPLLDRQPALPARKLRIFVVDDDLPGAKIRHSAPRDATALPGLNDNALFRLPRIIEPAGPLISIVK